MFLLNSPRNWGAQRCQDFDSGIREILSKFQTNMAILQLFDFANFVRHFSHYIFLLQFTLWEQETKHCQRQTAVNHNLFSQKDYKSWETGISLRIIHSLSLSLPLTFTFQIGISLGIILSLSLLLTFTFQIGISLGIIHSLSLSLSLTFTFQIAFYDLNPFPQRMISNKREHHQKVLKVQFIELKWVIIITEAKEIEVCLWNLMQFKSNGSV